MTALYKGDGVDLKTMTKQSLLDSISTERDIKVLMKHVNMCYDPDVMRAAANRVYDLTEGRKEK